MIIVIGTGIIGLHTAYDILQRGMKVTLLDFSAGASATNASVGMLAPIIEAKPLEKKLLTLMTDSKKIWDNLNINDRINNRVGLINNSSLLISMNNDDTEKLKFKKNFFKGLGINTSFLSSEETLKIEPCLNSNVHSSLFCKNQNQVNPKLLQKFLIQEILRLKGTIKKVKKIEKVFFDNNTLKIDDLKLKAKKIIICCGAWSDKLIENSFKIKLPMRPLKGVSMLVKAKEIKFKNNLWFRNIYVAQRAKSILAIGATEEEKGFEKNVSLDEVYFLTKSIWECFTEIEKISLEKLIVGLRPSMIDGYPVIGPLTEISDRILCNFGHYRHGILLSPISSQIIADYVFGEDVQKKYKYFSPQRFNL